MWISILQFSEYKSFASLDRFVPRYFIHFDAMVNGIVSLISLADVLMIVYRNARDFCVLILCPATLPNSLMTSSSFLVAFWGFSTYSIMSSTNSDSFVLLFQFEFISFSSLISMVRTSKTIFNKKWHEWISLSCDLRWDTCWFSLLRRMLAIGLSCRVFVTLRLGFPCGSAGKESACNEGDLGSIPGLGRSPGEGKGYPLQCSGLESSMDCTVHGVANSQTQLSSFPFHTTVGSLCTHILESFYYKWVLNVVKSFFCIWDNHMFFYSSVV